MLSASVLPGGADAADAGVLQQRLVEAQRQLLDRYEPTYALEQFVLRGEKLSLLKAHPHPWHVFLTVLGEEATVEESTRMDARMDGGGQARLLGTFDERPEYKQLDELVRARQKEAPPAWPPASGRIGRR